MLIIPLLTFPFLFKRNENKLKKLVSLNNISLKVRHDLKTFKRINWW